MAAKCPRGGCGDCTRCPADPRGHGHHREYSIMRHMMNIESVITYEGTTTHLLITGMDITGIAFK